MKNFVLFFITCLSILFSASTCAAAFQCIDLFSAYTEVLNRNLSEKYPELNFVLKNPDAFVLEMRHRFNEMKKIDPKNPHEFDFSEVGIPALKYARKSLIKKIHELRYRITELRQKALGTSPLNFYTLTKLENELNDLKVANRYFTELKQFADTSLEQGKITYLKSIKYLYYFSRAIGHFDNYDLPYLSGKYLEVDRKLQGYHQMSLADEYTLYKSGQFDLFQMDSKSSGFVRAEPLFAKIALDKERLGTILIPSPVSLDRDILMRLMSKEINIIGITADPIDADGFRRPGGDFWMHDLRHESGKIFEIFKYRYQRTLNAEQIKKLDELQDYWYYDLENKISQIKDPDFRNAVELMAFSYHHDRGFPLIPSLWLKRDSDKIAYALVFMLTISGQGAGYKNLTKNTVKAREWISQFWKLHLDEELQILSKRNINL